jgi:hypothetical protein
MIMAKSAPEIIATHLCYDMAEVSEGRYQWYRPTVYVCGNHYFCCPPKGRKPADPERFAWEKVWELDGRTVYRSK